jgi:hypothetical protein
MNKIATVLVVQLPLVVWAYRQQATQEHKPASAPGQKVVQKTAPTLGFNRMKDVSPIIDSDASVEEHEMENKLPGNKFVYDKRAMHEAALMNEFVEGFKDSKECNGITFYLKMDKKPEFIVQMHVIGHDNHPDDQTWTWMLFWPDDPSPEKKEGHGMGGMGSQSNGKLTAKDVCLTVWDDIDPNHFKRPGGKID